MKKSFGIRAVASAMLAAAGMAAGGCASEAQKECAVRQTQVSAVYMHKLDQFSVMQAATDGNGLELRWLAMQGCCGNTVQPRFFTDAPIGEPAFVIERFTGKNCRDLAAVEFHLHSVSEVKGAGWDQGKQGRGMVTVIDSE